jgi:hypothetical protein
VLTNDSAAISELIMLRNVGFSLRTAPRDVCGGILPALAGYLWLHLQPCQHTLLWEVPWGCLLFHQRLPSFLTLLVATMPLCSCMMRCVLLLPCSMARPAQILHTACACHLLKISKHSCQECVTAFPGVFTLSYCAFAAACSFLAASPPPEGPHGVLGVQGHTWARG